MRVQGPDTRPLLRWSAPAIHRSLPLRLMTAPHPTWFLLMLASVSVVGETRAAALETDPRGDEARPLESARLPEPRQQRAVFVCRDGDVPVFADRPCSDARASRTLVVDAPASGAVSSIQPPVPQAVIRPRPQPDGRGGTGRTAETRCMTLQRQLDELDARMRSGYPSREAARLWNRWRELKARLRGERC
jgi:hypothetical protein